MDLRSDSLATFTTDVCRIGLISSSNAPRVTRVPRMLSPHKKEKEIATEAHRQKGRRVTKKMQRDYAKKVGGGKKRRV